MTRSLSRLYRLGVHFPETAMQTDELRALVAAVILNQSKDPNSDASIETAVQTADKLLKRIQKGH